MSEQSRMAISVEAGYEEFSTLASPFVQRVLTGRSKVVFNDGRIIYNVPNMLFEVCPREPLERLLAYWESVFNRLSVYGESVVRYRPATYK